MISTYADAMISTCAMSDFDPYAKIIECMMCKSSLMECKSMCMMCKNQFDECAKVYDVQKQVDGDDVYGV